MGYPSNLISLCVLRALRGDISLLLKQISDCSRFHWPAKPSSPVTCDRFLPIKCSTERLQHLAPFAPWNTDSTKIELFALSAIPWGELFFLRSSPHRAKTAKIAKKTLLVLFLGALCPVEYRLDQDRVVRPKRYSMGRVIFSPIFSSSRQDRQDRKENFFDPPPWRPLPRGIFSRRGR